jgi:hypothetical protein
MQLNYTELAAWKSSELVVGRFLDNKVLNIAPKSFKVCYRATEIVMPDVIQNPTSYTHTHTHFRVFPENLGTVNDEQFEWFHRDMAEREQRYPGRWDPNMTRDYCCFLRRNGRISYKDKVTVRYAT